MKKEEKEELKKIKEMRKTGMTIAEISIKINKSISYVHTRLNKQYYPLKLRGG